MMTSLTSDLIISSYLWEAPILQLFSLKPIDTLSQVLGVNVDERTGLCEALDHKGCQPHATLRVAGTKGTVRVVIVFVVQLPLVT